LTTPDSADAWRAQLRAHFSDWGTTAWEDLWRSRPAPASIGQRLIGQVIAMAEFGVWLDAGLGTPVLLLVPYMLNDAPLTIEMYPALGASLTCWVRTVGSTGEIGVTQHSPDER
jgi:hypothetical protein